MTLTPSQEVALQRAQGIRDQRQMGPTLWGLVEIAEVLLAENDRLRVALTTRNRRTP